MQAGPNKNNREHIDHVTWAQVINLPWSSPILLACSKIVQMHVVTAYYAHLDEASVLSWFIITQKAQQ